MCVMRVSKGPSLPDIGLVSQENTYTPPVIVGFHFKIFLGNQLFSNQRDSEEIWFRFSYLCFARGYLDLPHSAVQQALAKGASEAHTLRHLPLPSTPQSRES